MTEEHFEQAYFELGDLVTPDCLTPLGVEFAHALIKAGWSLETYGIVHDRCVKVDVGPAEVMVGLLHSLTEPLHFAEISERISYALETPEPLATLPDPPALLCEQAEVEAYIEAVRAAFQLARQVPVATVLHVVMRSAYEYLEELVTDWVRDWFDDSEHAYAAVEAYETTHSTLPLLEKWGSCLGPLSEEVHRGSLRDYAWERLEAIAGTAFDELRPFLDADAMVEVLEHDGAMELDCHGEFYYVPH